MPISDFISGTWFVLYSSGIICSEYVKYKYRCSRDATSRTFQLILLLRRSETDANDDADAQYEHAHFNTMIKNVGRKLAATNIYYIKIFQAIAYSADIANEELTAFFRDYTDNVEFTNNEYSLRDLDDVVVHAKSIGYDLTIDTPEMPSKMGSISLVFYGSIAPASTVLQTPTPIVIKYLRANMRERIMTSIKNFGYMVWIMNKIPSLRYLHLNDIYNEQRVLMMEQIDFTREVACINEFYENCRDTRCIKVPIVYSEFSDTFPNIIVMERLIGKTLDQVDDDVKDHFCHSLARGLVKTVFIDGVYHCDLHPGNALFIEDGLNYRIGLLDFGIIGRLSVSEQELSYQVFHSIIHKDAERAINTIMEFYTEPYDTSLAYDRTDPVMLNTLLTYVREMVAVVVTCFSAENLCFINKELIKNNLKISRSFTKFELSLSVCDNLCKKLAVNRSYLMHLSEVIDDVFE